MKVLKACSGWGGEGRGHHRAGWEGEGPSQSGLGRGGTITERVGGRDHQSTTQTSTRESRHSLLSHSPLPRVYLVCKCPPGQVGHRVEPVVEEELGQHEEEAKGIDTIHEAVDGPGVPAGERRGGGTFQQQCPSLPQWGTDLLWVL